jgi:hypothetical protein
MNHNAGLSGSLLLDALKIQELQGELSRGLLFYVEPFAGTPTYRHQPNRSFTRSSGAVAANWPHCLVDYTQHIVNKGVHAIEISIAYPTSHSGGANTMAWHFSQ